ncbi:MAG TPA: alpha/beta fold hydrolase [Methylomirabilota bacterium]|nr:alpha/beta fold hydrolase [Methylomirabilota bacterium]
MRVVFLPGSGGDGRFWRPLAARLPADWTLRFLDWPGLGDVPPAADVNRFDDLVRLALRAIDGPVDLVAQSTGVVVALRIALERPDLTDRLADVHADTLLVWGEADRISPPAVGRELARLLPHAELVVISGGDHALARDRAAEVAPHVVRHLA